MTQRLEFQSLKKEDIEFLQKNLRREYGCLFFFAIPTVFFPAFVIYIFLVDKNDAIGSMGKLQVVLLVILIFGFWIYVVVKWLMKVLTQRKKMYSQKKIVGHVEILEKIVFTHKGSESSDSYSYLLKMYSDIEKIERKISVKEDDFNRIQVGNLVWIEYFSHSDNIKSLIFLGKELSIKTFR